MVRAGVKSGPVEQEKSLKPMVQIEEVEVESFRGLRLLSLGMRRGVGMQAAKARSEMVVTRARRRRLKLIVVIL